MFKNICWAFSGGNVLSQEKVDLIMEKGLSAHEQVATHQLNNLERQITELEKSLKDEQIIQKKEEINEIIAELTNRSNIKTEKELPHGRISCI